MNISIPHGPGFIKFAYVLRGGGYKADQRPKAIIEAAMELKHRYNTEDFSKYVISFDSVGYTVTTAEPRGNFPGELAWAMEMAGITELPVRA